MISFQDNKAQNATDKQDVKGQRPMLTLSYDIYVDHIPNINNVRSSRVSVSVFQLNSCHLVLESCCLENHFCMFFFHILQVYIHIHEFVFHSNHSNHSFSDIQPANLELAPCSLSFAFVVYEETTVHTHTHTHIIH